MKAHFSKNCECPDKGRPTLRVLKDRVTKKVSTVDLEVGVICNKCRKPWEETPLK